MWTYWRGSGGMWCVGRDTGRSRAVKERTNSRRAAAMRAHVLNGGDERDDVDLIEYEQGARIGQGDR